MDEIGNLLDRPRLYCNIDGLGELAGGAMCLGFALILWPMTHTPAGSVWERIPFFAFVVLMVLIHYGTKAAKTRITYPRTGFVEYRKQWNTSAIAAVSGALAAVGLSVVSRRHWDVSMLAPLAGLAFAAAYGYYFARAVRWKWAIAGAMALTPFVIAFFPTDVLTALGSDSPAAHPARARLSGSILVSLMVYGTMLLVSGGISLWLYLRRTPAPAQDGQ